MKIKPRKLLAVGMAGATATALGLAAGTPAHAAIANPSLVMSNNQSGGSSTYTYTFTPGLSVTQILAGFNGVVGIPGGASGLSGASVSVFENTGSGWGSALAGVTSTANTAGNVLGVAVPSGDFTGLTSVPQLKVVVSNLTNPTVTVSTTAGGCVADAVSAITGIAASVFTSGTSGTGAAFSSGLAPLADTGCLTTTIVPLGTNGVTQQVNVAPVLNVSLPATADSFSIIPTPAGAALSFPTDNLTVATNALSYSVEALISNTSSALRYDGTGNYALPITATTGSCSGSPADLGSNGTYSALASSLPGLTNGTLTPVSYCGGNVSLTLPSGSYSGTITYLVVPSF